MSSRFTKLALGSALLLLLGATVELLAQAPPGAMFGSRRRASGAPAVPVFEGWEPNPDGTFVLYFGYQNRNWEEELDIPVGPNNFFSPGQQDRGQPTHFLVNRQKKVFSVVVPRDFGDQILVWTLISKGSTEKVPGKLSPLLMVEATKNADTAAPKVDLGPEQTIVFPQTATLTATISSRKEEVGIKDAGRRGRAGRAPALTVKWRQFRGPGKITFSEPAPIVRDGKAVTTATFSEPGVYVIQAIGDEGSMNEGTQSGGIPGFICCWTNAQVTVTVKPG